MSWQPCIECASGGAGSILGGLLGGWKNAAGWGGGLNQKWPICGGGDYFNGNGAPWHGVDSCDQNLLVSVMYDP